MSTAIEVKNEHTWMEALLSRNVRVRILVAAVPGKSMGVEEIDNLIRRLTLDRAILADTKGPIEEGGEP